MRNVIREYTDEVNTLWVHKTIDALIALDEYPLLAPLRHTTDEEVLEITRKHTQEPLQNANAALRTCVINEITNLDWKRRMDNAIENIAEFYEGTKMYEATRVLAKEHDRVRQATEMLQQILNGGELWVRDIPNSESVRFSSPLYI